MRPVLTILAILLVGGALAVLGATLALAVPPPVGTCPNAQFTTTSATVDITSDLNGNGSICVKTVAGGTPAEGPLYIDDTAHPHS